jgi:hypothetical protein
MKRLLVLIALLGLPLTSPARIYRPWTYDQLHNEADLVVIARPTQVKEVGEERVPDVCAVISDGRGSNVIEDVVGTSVETTFEVLATLKGDATIKYLVLHHYRVKKSGSLRLVSFDPKDDKRYLLFLKHESDTKYCPVSGQPDAGFAVKETKDEGLSRIR